MQWLIACRSPQNVFLILQTKQTRVQKLNSDSIQGAREFRKVFCLSYLIMLLEIMDILLDNLVVPLPFFDRDVKNLSGSKPD